MLGVRNTNTSALRKRPPAAVSLYFTLRLLHTNEQPLIQVAVPVRVEAGAVRRNRIRRQVSETLRVLYAKTRTPYHLAITVRRSDIPQGQALQDALFELLRESGMMEQR